MAGAIDTNDSTDLTASQEDYLEAIYAISLCHHVVRPKDIIARLKVRGASVTGALRILAERGLVHYTPYDAVTLTPDGVLAARDITRRHQELTLFLSRTLGVEPRLAEKAACRMEHAISRTILNRLNRLAEFISACPRCRRATGAPPPRPGTSAAPDCGRCHLTYPEELRPHDATHPPPDLG